MCPDLGLQIFAANTLKSVNIWNMLRKIWGSYEGDWRLRVQYFRISLNLKAVRSTKTTVDIYHTTRRHILDDSNLRTVFQVPC
jgi:hypothetical protein